MSAKLPYGGIVVSGGAVAQGLTATLAQLTAWSGVAGGKSQANSFDYDGDPAVRPDPTNNRLLLNCPGNAGGQTNYRVDCIISAFVDSAVDVKIQLRKNGVLQVDGGLTAEDVAGGSVAVISAAPTGIPGGNVGANTTSDVALTAITGLRATDVLLGVTKPATQAGLFILPSIGAQGGVTGAAAATVKYVNVTGVGITPTGGETYSFFVARPGRIQLTFSGILKMLSSDNPATVATFADPTVPPSKFVGAGGAPLTECPVDLAIGTLAGTANITVEFASLMATLMSA